MRIDSHDYFKLVLADLGRKRLNGDLSSLLVSSTPANLRRECATVYQEGLKKKDEKTLRAFFGRSDFDNNFINFIENFPLSKFKPLDNLLKKGTVSTEIKNLELLAWLIDFQHRPMEFAKEVNLTDIELLVLGKNSSDGRIMEVISPREQLPVENSPTPGRAETVKSSLHGGGIQADQDSVALADSVNKKKSGKRRIIAGVLIFLVIILCMISFWLSKDQGCMYWADDHYVEISCDQKKIRKLIIPIDAERLNTFMKIMNNDTISKYSLGKLFYLKTNREIECFTSGGYHPIYINRELNPLTQRILDTLIKRRNSNKQ